MFGDGRMPDLPEGIVVECHGVRAASDGLHELDENRAVVTVPRDMLRHVELRYGVSNERPLLVVAFGLVLLLIALGLAGLLVLWFLGGGVAYDVEFALLLLGPLGAWLMHAAVRRRFFLLVQTEHELRKLAFSKAATFEELRSFADKAEPVFEISVHASTQEARPSFPKPMP